MGGQPQDPRLQQAGGAGVGNFAPERMIAAPNSNHFVSMMLAHVAPALVAMMNNSGNVPVGALPNAAGGTTATPPPPTAPAGSLPPALATPPAAGAPAGAVNPATAATPVTGAPAGSPSMPTIPASPVTAALLAQAEGGAGGANGGNAGGGFEANGP